MSRAVQIIRKLGHGIGQALYVRKAGLNITICRSLSCLEACQYVALFETSLNLRMSEMFLILCGSALRYSNGQMLQHARDSVSASGTLSPLFTYLSFRTGLARPCPDGDLTDHEMTITSKAIQGRSLDTVVLFPICHSIQEREI